MKPSSILSLPATGDPIETSASNSGSRRLVAAGQRRLLRRTSSTSSSGHILRPVAVATGSSSHLPQVSGDNAFSNSGDQLPTVIFSGSARPVAAPPNKQLRILSIRTETAVSGSSDAPAFISGRPASPPIFSGSPTNSSGN
ncbi:uncharacterized protein LOC127245580 [Andrographis paniculata]|uniref:uncharacterized protein LOC127245580 n=1 Tax=Andrographis paniculata TaxID=175694 RepID=UPI0021E95638|nr:uncharacterized protein LOC127245580 [Andrographis paniculata]